jgi:hypothetical protein
LIKKPRKSLEESIGQMRPKGVKWPKYLSADDDDDDDDNDIRPDRPVTEVEP